MTHYIKRLPAKPQKGHSPHQGVLDLKVDLETEIDGIGMGILSDGTPFLNQRGLARLCGVQNAHIGTISSDWDDPQKPRIGAIKRILTSRGLEFSAPHLRVRHGAQMMFAYPEPVCMAILEYYAFDAGINIQEEAKAKYRWLAGRSLREIIYDQLGYKPTSKLARTWQQFQDRVSLTNDVVPAGYFCVFKEIADLMVTLINAGVPIGDTFVPDISVGRSWSEYWTEKKLSEKFGDSDRYKHHYPNYFPQAASNPQTPRCYPEDALGEFRRWMREIYLPLKLPGYLNRKVRDGQLAPGEFTAALNAFAARGIGHAAPDIKALTG